MDKSRSYRYWSPMTPERRQQLMDQAAKELRSQWGEVQPDAMQALDYDLRAGVIESGAPSANDIVSEVTHGPHSQSLFKPAQASGQIAPSAAQAADRPRDMDLER